MTTTSSRPLPEAPNQIELAIGGMTCAACAARIEKKLNRMDGVSATVNYATEKATVRYADAVTPDDLIETVQKTGYTAALPSAPAEEQSVDPLKGPRTRLWVSVALSVPVSCWRWSRPGSSTTGSGCR